MPPRLSTTTRELPAVCLVGDDVIGKGHRGYVICKLLQKMMSRRGCPKWSSLFIFVTTGEVLLPFLRCRIENKSAFFDLNLYQSTIYGLLPLLQQVLMKTEIKIYKIKDFVRKTVSGEIDMNKSMAFVKQFADIAYVHPDHNILLDMRDTEVTNANITDMMKISLEFANSLPDFKNKIANVIPDNEERLRTARQFHSCMVLKGFSYQIFTDFEKAIDWLSDSTLTNRTLPLDTN